ncbi:hypothetical protein [Pseudomonas sp. CLCA07]
MSAKSCEVAQIDSMDLSEYQKIALQYGDGNLIFLWSLHFDKKGQPTKEKPDLVVKSEKELSKPEIEDLQKRLQQRLRGGCWHEIDD